jgi:Tfp pilus assembly protein PilO
VNKLRKLPKAKLQMMILLGIVTLIGIAGMWLFWISTSLTKLAANTDKIARLQTQITELESKAKLDARNQPLLEQIVAFVRPLGSTMLAGDAYMWTVRELRQREEKFPVKIVSIRQGSTGPHPRRSGWEHYALAIDVEGTYDQIGEFVRDFENEFTTSEVRRLELSAVDSASTLRRAAVQLAFLVYPEAKMGPRQAKEEPAK